MKFSHVLSLKLFKLMAINTFLILTSCGNDDMSDLEAYVEDVIEKPGEGIEPLEKVKSSDFFLFKADDSRNPFLMRKKKAEPEKKEEKKQEKEDEAIEEVPIVPVKKPPTDLKPDFDRIKEDLESFSLDSMSMVGTVKKNGIWGLIKFEGGVQKVRVGNYIGKNHGLILEITKTSIKIEEIIEEEEDRWIKERTELSLKLEADEPK